MSEVVKTTHRGIEISYNETKNTWHFTLRGRDRTAETLANAKAAIDKPDPSGKKPFERIKAIMTEYGTNFLEGEITSIAENGYGRQYVWFTTEPRGRRKELLSLMRADTAENRALMAEALILYDQASKASKKASQIAESMSKVEITIPD